MATPTPEQIRSYLEAIMSGTVDSPSFDPGFQDYQDDFMASTKAGTSLFADQAYNIANQTVDPGVYAPLTSFEPVEMPGASQLAKWRTGNDYQQFVASQLDSGTATPNSILSQLAAMAAAPKNDTEKAIVGWLPPAFRFDDITNAQTQQGTDFQAVGDEIRNLYTAINSDPQNTVIDPSTGLPSTVTMEDSPYTKKLRSLGFTSTPGQPYDPYDFAPEGVTAESDAALKEMQRRTLIQGGLEDVGARLDESKYWDTQKAYQRALAAPPTSISGRPRDGDTRDWSGQSPATQAWWLAQDAGNTLGGVNATLPTQPGELEAANMALDWGGKIFLKPGQESPQLPPGIPVPDVVGRHASAFEGTPTEIAMKGIAAGGGALFNAAKGLFGGGGGGGGGNSPQVVQSMNTVPGSAPVVPPNLARNNQGFVQSVVRGAQLKALKDQREAARKAMIAQQTTTMDAKRTGIMASIEVEKARRRDAMRRQQVAALQAQGRTPFGDDVQRRMAGIYGLNP